MPVLREGRGGQGVCRRGVTGGGNEMERLMMGCNESLE